MHATRLPLSADRPLPWPVVAAFVAGVLGLLLLFTVYLPARHAASQGNSVRVQDLTISVSAAPAPASAHGVDLAVAIQPVPEDGASVEVLPAMPVMGSMHAESVDVRPAGPGAYRAQADLGMGGLWEVQVTVRRPGRAAATAHFRLNA